MAATIIEHIEVGTPAASITFDSIPNTGAYEDLFIQVSAQDNGRGGNVANWFLEVNDLQTSIYVDKYLYGYQNSVNAGTSTHTTGLFLTRIGISLSTFGSTGIYISQYASSTSKLLSIEDITEKAASEAATGFLGGYINTTAAISKIRLYCADSAATSNGTFNTRTTATLYGMSSGL